MELLSIIAIISVFVFSISATLQSIQKRYDMFGIAFVTFVTSVGGGTVRDLLLGCHPLFWMEDPTFVIAILTGVFSTFVFKRKMLILKQTKQPDSAKKFIEYMQTDEVKKIISTSGYLN